MWEQVRNASPDNVFARVSLAAHYARQGEHDRASTVVEELFRVRPDFTIQELSVVHTRRRCVGSHFLVSVCSLAINVADRSDLEARRNVVPGVVGGDTPTPNHSTHQVISGNERIIGQ